MLQFCARAVILHRTHSHAADPVSQPSSGCTSGWVYCKVKLPCSTPVAFPSLLRDRGLATAIAVKCQLQLS